jgi:7-carboxy-7-deazaguanine synthase
MTYSVKEIFYTLQGEGGQAGMPAVFCRFAGCNLWSGREADRATAQCRFCDTDFVGTDGEGGGRFKSATSLADAIARTWGDGAERRYVVFTGGEPLLQLDAAAIDALHAEGFEIAVETNGTIEPPPGLDWVCVSPKGRSVVVVRAGHELKFVYPQEDLAPEAFEELAFDHFFIQPMDGLLRKQNTERAVSFCLANARWRLGLQTHKVLGIS